MGYGRRGVSDRPARWRGGDGTGGCDRVVTGVGLVLVLLAAGQVVLGAAVSSITVDEPRHVDRMRSWLEVGWYVPAGHLEAGMPAAGDPIASPFVYGPAFSVIAHLVNVLVGNEPAGAVSQSFAAYTVRHLTVAALGLLAAALVAVSVRSLTGSAPAAVWSAAALLAIPAWTGHSMFNVKDIPVAAGYTAITAGLVLALEPAGGARRVWRSALLVALIGGGLFLAVGTRTAIWVPAAAAACGFAALGGGRRRRGGGGPSRAAVVAVVLGASAGAVLLGAVYPRAAATPAAWLTSAVTESSSFPWSGFTLTAGMLLPERPPVWYLPLWTFASLPLLLGGVAGLGSWTVLAALFRRAAPAGAPPPGGWTVARAALVVLQAVLVPALAVASASVMYNGIRQHLYMLPAIAVLAGVGAAALLRSAKRPDGGQPWRSRLVAALLSGALVLPTFEQLLLFPYNYTYVNPLAGIGGVENRWETDYWFNSQREALGFVPAAARTAVRCSQKLIVPWSPDEPMDLRPCRERLRDAATGGGEAAVAPLSDQWVVGRRRAGNAPPDSCTTVDRVTRWVRGERVTMGFVLRCPSSATASGGGG